MAATDNVEKGIRRGDAELAVQALLRLAPAERAPFIDQVGVLFRAAVQADHQAKNWSKLTSWASRAEKLPGLEGTTPESFPTHWALTWGAIKTKEWERARRWYGPLHPALSQRSPGFAAAMEALVAERATPELAAPFVPPSSAADPRLGHEPKRLRAEWTAPLSPAEASDTLLALVGTEPWGVFAATVTQWATRVDEPTRRSMLELAGQLATRETVKRLASNAPRPGEPAELLRLIVEALDAPAALTDEVLLLFRLLAARMPSMVDAQAPTREFTHAALAACAYPAHRPLVVGTVTTLKFFPGAVGHILGLLERLVGQHPEPTLVGKALALLSNCDPHSGDLFRPSPALQRALLAALATDRDGMSGWFNGLAPAQRANVGQWMAFVLPIDTVQSFILAVWPGASPPARSDLASIVESVFLSLQPLPDLFDLDAIAGPLAGGVPKKARPLWNAVRDLVITQGTDFLFLALRDAAEGDDVMALITRALGDAPSAQRLLETWADLYDEELMHPASRVEGLFFAKWGSDTAALVKGVLFADRYRFPVAFKRRLAEGLLGVADRADASPSLDTALGLAKRWLAGRKTKAPREPKPKKPRKPKKGKTTPPPDDDPIPF